MQCVRKVCDLLLESECQLIAFIRAQLHIADALLKQAGQCCEYVLHMRVMVGGIDLLRRCTGSHLRHGDCLVIREKEWRKIEQANNYSLFLREDYSANLINYGSLSNYL